MERCEQEDYEVDSYYDRVNQSLTDSDTVDQVGDK